jgi:hypothetical protein
MTVTDDLLAYNKRYAAGFKKGDLGIRPPFAVESFRAVDAAVRESMALIAASPFIPNKRSVRGFVYDVKTGPSRGELAGRPGEARWS